MSRRAAFLDRDGTLVIERHYLADPRAVELVPGAVDALKRLREAGYAIVVVTNQSGIARGLYTAADFLAVEARIEELFAAGGVTIDAVYHCPHHPDFTGPCECRKPGPGMFQQAAADLDVDLHHSIFIGDRLKDVTPARAYGAMAFLVRTGYGALQELEADADIVVVEDVRAAVDRALSKTDRRASYRVDTPRKPE